MSTAISNRNLRSSPLLAAVVICGVAFVCFLATVLPHKEYVVAALAAFAIILYLSSSRLAALLILLCYLPFQGLLTDVYATNFLWVALIKDILLVWVLSIFLFRVLFDREWPKNGFAKTFLVFGIVFLAYLPFCPNLLRGALEIRGVILYPLVSIVVLYTVRDGKDARLLLRALAIVGAVTIIYGLAQYFTGFDTAYRAIRADFEYRATRFGAFEVLSTFPTRPDFGAFLNAAFLLVFLVPLWKRTFWYSLARMAFLTGAGVCVFLTYSRTTWVAWLVGLSTALFLTGRRWALALLLLAVVLAGAAYETQSGRASVQTEEAVSDFRSVGDRFEVWRYALSVARSKPFGSGIGTVGGALVFEAPERITPTGNEMFFTDNQFLKFLVEGGFILLSAFLAVLVSIFRQARTVLTCVRNGPARDVAIWASASLLSVLQYFFAEDYIGTNTSICIYCVALGLLAWLASHRFDNREFAF